MRRIKFCSVMSWRLDQMGFIFLPDSKLFSGKDMASALRSLETIIPKQAIDSRAFSEITRELSVRK